MINILSYVGMNLQSEVCLWCLLGLLRTIFDATLFKVNANLKQVWQMNMPEELSMPVQRALRTMVSGIMLVQCFTVYIYLASYIVLLYPVFLEERPTLVLPWLLLAAIRKLLCELTSLALGLGTCVLLGPARTPCIKFVVVKFTTIMPAFYMWMLVFSYYHALKVATAFKTFPAVLPPSDNDYGLELAVRRRRTKSLLGEDQLRKKLVASFYGEGLSTTNESYLRPQLDISSKMVHSTDTNAEEDVPEPDAIKPSTGCCSDSGAYEDWFGSEIIIPRDTDRILEQIVLMLLRVGAYMKNEVTESLLDPQRFSSAVPALWHSDNIDCTINAGDSDTPQNIGSSRGNTASYLREYPQIFMKKTTTDKLQTEPTTAPLKTVHSNGESDEFKHKTKRNSPSVSHETLSTPVELEQMSSKKNVTKLDTTTEQDSQSKNVSGMEATKEKLTFDKQSKIGTPLRIRSSQLSGNTNNSVQINKVSGDNINKSSNNNLNQSEKANDPHLVNANADSEKSIASIIQRANQNREINLKLLEEYTSMVYNKIMNSDDHSREISDDFIINEFNELINGTSTLAQMLNLEHDGEFVLNTVANELRNRHLFASGTSNQPSDDAVFHNYNRDSDVPEIFYLDSQENFMFRKVSNDIDTNSSPKAANEDGCDNNSDSKILSKDEPQSDVKGIKYATDGLIHDNKSDNEIKTVSPDIKISSDDNMKNLMQNNIVNVGKNEDFTEGTKIDDLTKDTKTEDLTHDLKIIDLTQGIKIEDLTEGIKIEEITQGIKIEDVTDKKIPHYYKPKEVPLRIMSIEDNLGPEGTPTVRQLRSATDKGKEVTPTESKRETSQNNVLNQEKNETLKKDPSKDSTDTNDDSKPNSSENTKRNA
ncbi:unnamed protein product [Spodoptera littoralis]|uniref:Uncharacterized protein n=1 Tax=Spodoptera littoralis TaxID=7109 RepID=A0A9P0IDE7_SPOLI|nr:unnamed protein product [Spodoptera littoralis]CAH1645535.1 unnamed protein product [Spodoptera littoralis]